MDSNQTVLRRDILAAASTALTASLFTGRVKGANDRIAMGFIGVGTMGTDNLRYAMQMPGVQPVAITAGGLTVLLKQGYKKTIEADSIVIALPLEPDKELLRACEGKVAEIHAIGDCASPGLIVDAIGNGWRISSSI